MQSIEAPVELDFKKTNEDWEGKWLTEDAYDTVIHTKDYEGVNIFSPAGTLDPTPIATVIPNVYDLVSYESIVSHLLDIDETSTMRANAAGPIDHEEMKAKGLIEGVVETLDKASSVKESKLIYETIKDTFTISKRKMEHGMILLQEIQSILLWLDTREEDLQERLDSQLGLNQIPMHGKL